MDRHRLTPILGLTAARIIARPTSPPSINSEPEPNPWLMISNERRWPSQRPAQRLPQPYYERPPRPPEDLLASREFQIERKRFVILFKQNPRGRFVRIIEGTDGSMAGRTNSIIIPASGLAEFQNLLREIAEAAAEIPPKG